MVHACNLSTCWRSQGQGNRDLCLKTTFCTLSLEFKIWFVPWTNLIRQTRTKNNQPRFQRETPAQLPANIRSGVMCYYRWPDCSSGLSATGLLWTVCGLVIKLKDRWEEQARRQGAGCRVVHRAGRACCLWRLQCVVSSAQPKADFSPFKSGSQVAQTSNSWSSCPTSHVLQLQACATSGWRRQTFSWAPTDAKCQEQVQVYKNGARAEEMTLVADSLIPRVHMVEEENQMSSDLHMCSMHVINTRK